MRGWLAVGVVCVLFLSGCAQKPSTATSSSTSSSPGSPDTSTPSASPASTSTVAPSSTATTSKAPAAAAPNHAPTGSIKANRTTGAAPLKVSFKLNATDADGDKVSYAVDFDGNGTVDAKLANATFPAQLNHTYAKAGSYNVTLTLTDGKNSTSYKTQVNVTAPAPAGPTGPAPIVLKGHINAASVSAIALSFCGGEPGGSTAGIWNKVAVPAAAIGGKYTASPAGAMYEFGDSTNGDADTGPIAPTGTVGAHTDELWVCTDNPAMANFDWTLTITPLA